MRHVFITVLMLYVSFITASAQKGKDIDTAVLHAVLFDQDIKVVPKHIYFSKTNSKYLITSISDRSNGFGSLYDFMKHNGWDFIFKDKIAYSGDQIQRFKKFKTSNFFKNPVKPLSTDFEYYIDPFVFNSSRTKAVVILQQGAGSTLSFCLLLENKGGTWMVIKREFLFMAC